MEFAPAAKYEKAGLMVFQNEKHFYFMCKSIVNNIPVIQLFKSKTGTSGDSQMELLASRELDDGMINKAITLKVEALGNTYSFLYATDKVKWNTLSENVDATFLSTRTAGGFVGCMYTLYATSLGKPSATTAYFDWYEATGNDEVYR
jgi:xylan 1,4-beta-xylosidase